MWCSNYYLSSGIPFLCITLLPIECGIFLLPCLNIILLPQCGILLLFHTYTFIHSCSMVSLEQWRAAIGCFSHCSPPARLVHAYSQHGMYNRHLLHALLYYISLFSIHTHLPNIYSCLVLLNYMLPVCLLITLCCMCLMLIP